MILDSNIIIYSVQPQYVWPARYLQVNESIVHVSLISTLEVLGFSRLLLTDKLVFEAYFASVPILPLTDTIINEAIRLRQQRRRSLGDSIVAATALLHKLPVLTHNVANFSTVEGLHVISLTDVMNA